MGDAYKDAITLGPALGPEQMIDLRDPEDDWSGKSDPAQRRKLQNRLHQRAWRRRRAKRREEAASIRKENEGASTTNDLHLYLRQKPKHTLLTTDSNRPVISSCHATHSELEQVLEAFKQRAYLDLLLGSPRIELLPTLVRVNSFRAFAENALALGCGSSWLDGEATSDFINMGTLAHVPPSLDFPKHLQPTNLQHSVEHHPWIDLLPLAQMRDNILRLGDAYDDAPLCKDVVEMTDNPSDRAGLIVWGDPWDAKNWEVSEEFLKKWTWVLMGCWELCNATNLWRAKRGERPLFTKAWCQPPGQVTELEE